MPLTKMSINIGRCHNTYANLIDAFPFEDSPEGNEFWRLIVERLHDMSVGEVPTKPLNSSWGAQAKLLEHTVKELAKTNNELDAKVKELRRKLLAADFLSMGR